MSYTPTTWNTGDTITAEKLNNLEGGVSYLDGNYYIMDYTEFGYLSAEEQCAAFDAAMAVLLAHGIVEIKTNSINNYTVRPVAYFHNPAHDQTSADGIEFLSNGGGTTQIYGIIRRYWTNNTCEVSMYSISSTLIN